MRLELDPNSTTILHPETLEQQVPTKPHDDLAVEHLKEGIQAARTGDRQAARRALLRAVELDPQSETGWLWLSSISEYPEELLTFLTRVLEINPSNERAVEWAAATNALLAKSFVQRGIDAADSGEHDIAESHFQRAIEHDDKNTVAWLWLASLSQDDEKRVGFFEKVLEIEPANELALNGVGETRDRMRESLLDEARKAALENRPDECIAKLDSITEQYPDWTEAWLLKAHAVTDFHAKLEAFRKVLQLDPENSAAKAGTESIEAVFSGGTAEVCDAALRGPSFSSDEPNGPWSSDPPEFPIMKPDFESEPVANSEAEPDQDVLAKDAVSDEQTEWSAVSDVEAAWNRSDAEGPQLESAGWQAEDPDVEEISYELDAAEYSFDQVSANAYTSEEVRDEFEPDEVDQVHQQDEMAAVWVDDAPFAGNDGNAGEYIPQTLVSISIDDETRAAICGYELDNPSEGSQSESDARMSETHADAAELASDVTSSNVVQFSASRADNTERTEVCPFCENPIDSQTFTCRECLSVLTLSDLELLLANQNADKAVVRKAVDSMEREASHRELNEQELTALAIGHLNLRNLQFGYNFLREASQKNPNNVVLSSQVNALLIRLEEIKEQEALHSSMARGKTILVVDDSPTVRKLISGKLEKCGHEVHCSIDGEEAISKLEQLRPDLILLDINMPRMDGYQACKLIRSNPATKDVPVVMISGKDGFFDKVRGRMVGTSGYITKPFGPEALMKAVEFYLNPNA